MKKQRRRKVIYCFDYREKMPLDWKHFHQKINEVHLLSWHRDHFKLFLKCKDVPVNDAVIKMKRTLDFY